MTNKFKVIFASILIAAVLGFLASLLGFLNEYLMVVLVIFLCYAVIDLIKTGYRKLRSMRGFFK